MESSQSLTLSKNTFRFNILDSLEVNVRITENPYLLLMEDLFTMAARINNKRAFLFVSKVLGKHIPIQPNKGLLIGALLAARFIEKVKKIECLETERLLTLFQEDQPSESFQAFISSEINPVIIGFAETATALGHSFFSSFTNADYFHTTREYPPGIEPVITFEEEHSHATSHRCYIHKELLNHTREVILVDDEMTTGKTALNIIRSLHSQFPRPQYTVVSILDWRSDENKAAFWELEKELGITIQEVCLIAGKVEVNQTQEIQEKSREKKLNHETGALVEKIYLGEFLERCHSYLKATGRFGLMSKENQVMMGHIVEAGSVLRELRNGNMTLCLGTGEFMYIPMKLAAEMGRGVSFQSTTRSPIHVHELEGYGARFGAVFPSPEDISLTNYVYNIPPEYYDELFIFFEKEVEWDNLLPLLSEMEQLGIQSIKLVFLTTR